jgi:hypothetical protein
VIRLNAVESLAAINAPNKQGHSSRPFTPFLDVETALVTWEVVMFAKFRRYKKHYIITRAVKSNILFGTFKYCRIKVHQSTGDHYS